MKWEEVEKCCIGLQKSESDPKAPENWAHHAKCQNETRYFTYVGIIKTMSVANLAANKNESRRYKKYRTYAVEANS